jgi:Holliday junction resolvase
VAMTPEAKVKKRAVVQLKKLGAYYFYPVTGGYGKSGVPDIIGCYEGLFLGLECKAGKGKPTKLQELNLRLINEAGGYGIIVDETNVDDLAALIMEAHDGWS